MAPLYFAFRIMVACGVIMLLIIGLSFWNVIRGRIGQKMAAPRGTVRFAAALIAIESGWFVAEYGRQPWAIGEVLPTAVANFADRGRHSVLDGADLRLVHPVPGG